MSLLSTLNNTKQRARLGLFLGVLGGIFTAVFFIILRPNPPTTFDVFYYAAKQSLSGPVVYETGYGLWTYTPASLLYFYPYAILFDFETALSVHRLISVIFTLSYGISLVKFVSLHAETKRIDDIAVFLFSTLSVYPVVNVINGSFVGIFTTLLGLGWILMETRRDYGGALWALASIVKGYPAFWGAYMIRIRNWKAILAAVVTGLSSTAIGLLLFGIDAYTRFFTAASMNRVRYEMFRGGASPDNEAVTPLRALGQLFPNVDPSFWTPVILLIILCITLIVYYAIPSDSVNNRATLLLVTILGVWFVLPTSQDLDVYIVYAPLIALLFVERQQWIQSLYVLGLITFSYNFGRTELETVSELFGLAEFVMIVGEPVLSFATMPMYGLFMLYVGCIGKAYYCFKN